MRFIVPETLREHLWLSVAKASVTYWTYVRSPVSWPLVPTELLKLITKRRTSFRRSIRHTGVSSGIDFTPGKTKKCGLKQNCLWANLILKVCLCIPYTHERACLQMYSELPKIFLVKSEHQYFWEFEQFTFSKIFLSFKRKSYKIKLQWYCYPNSCCKLDELLSDSGEFKNQLLCKKPS